VINARLAGLRVAFVVVFWQAGGFARWDATSREGEA
jgi:hypothetical protein